MALQDELQELNLNMSFNGRAYETFYQMGLGIPFLKYLNPKSFGKIQYLENLSEKELEYLNPIKHKTLLEKVGGLYQAYMELIFIDESLNLDWFESLEEIICSKGYLRGIPIKFYLNYKDSFIKYCEFILGKNDYNFVPNEEDIIAAKEVARIHTGRELSYIFDLSS